MKTPCSQERLLQAVWAFVFWAVLGSTGHAQVGLKPVITSQPSDIIVLNNGSATFRVEASSATAMSYKWYFNSNLISGATASSYSRNPALLSAGHAGFYHVEVINAAGSTLSHAARLTILASNDIPVANDDAYATQEDVPLAIPAAGILTNDWDTYPGTLFAALVTGPIQGNLSFNPDGSFTYDPNPGYSGSDRFTYRTSDGGTTILEENPSGGNKQEIKHDEPGAQSFRHGTAGDSAYSIRKVVLRLSRKSNQNRNLNFSIGTGINSGPIAGSSHIIAMTGISNTTDGASFQNYDIVYNPPVGPMAAGTTYYLNLAHSPNGKEVFVESAGRNSYPRGTYYKKGSDDGKDMRFEIHEETFSGIATVTLNVTAEYDPPVAVSDRTNTLEAASVTINVLANDLSPEGLPLTITDIFTTNGTAMVSGPNVTFTPAPNFHGTAVFDYTISDGRGSSTASVVVNVVPVRDDPPVAYDDTYSVAQDTSLSIPAAGVLANDDGKNKGMTAVLVSNVASGYLDLKPDGSFAYTPNPKYNGGDSFTYRAADGLATGNVATVTINVIPTNAPLRFVAQRMTANGFELVLSGPVRSTYIILASTNFTDWFPISTNYTDTGNVVFTDADAAKRARCFYRAMVLATNSVLEENLSSKGRVTSSAKQ